MQNLLNKAIWFIGFMVVIFMILIAYYSKNSTKVLPKEEVEVIVNKMSNALNVGAWQKMQDTFVWQRDSTIAKWHKASDKLILQRSNTKIEMSGKGENPQVYVNGNKVDNPTEIELARERWNEDAFYLFAPYLIFDGSNHRTLTPMEKGHIGLLVENRDNQKYLWSINPHYLPDSTRLLFRNININNFDFGAWQNWQTLQNGMKVALNHSSNDKNIIYSRFEIINVK